MVLTVIQKKKVRFLDTTLRDGLQSPSVHFNDKAKIEIACALDRAGIDVIEAGFPSASKKQFDVIDAICGEVKGSVAVMGRMNEKDISICAQSLRKSASGCIHVSVPASKYLRESKTGLDTASTTKLALQSLSLIKSSGFIAEIGIEDAGRTEYSYVEELCRVLSENGADIINIADTSGFMQTDEFGHLIKKLHSSVLRFETGETVLSVHCHNDFGLAAANTLAGIYNGASQVETTIGGVGERSGNAQFEAVLAALEERPDYYNAETNIEKKSVASLCELVRKHSCLIEPDSIPLSGRNSFLHSSGIHQKALIKSKNSYSIINPEVYGFDKDRFDITVFSGSGAFVFYVKELCGLEIEEETASVYLSELKNEYHSNGVISATDILSFIYKKGLFAGEIWFLSLIKSYEENAPGEVLLEVELNSINNSILKCAASGSDFADVSAKIINDLFNQEIEIIQTQTYSSGSAGSISYRCDFKASFSGKIYYSSNVAERISESVFNAFLDIHNQIGGCNA